MAYVLPQVLVFQEFNIAPAATAVPRSAHIAGPQAKLFRYSNSDEKDVINLGEYDSVSDTPYLWPERPAGSQVDFSFVKLYAEDALLEYYVNDSSVGSTVAPVSGFKNRVRDAGTSFKSNGTSYPRSAVMYDRDAQVGDVVYVRGINSGTPYELTTSIKGFAGETIAGAVNTTEVYDSSNKTNQTLSVVSQTLGLKNAVTVSANASAYDGRPTGDITETYTVEVIKSSVDADFTTARFRVTSASGRDNQASITPATAGSATEIGTRGLLVTFNTVDTNSTSSIANLNGISENDLVVGQKWSFTVNQAFTAPTITAAGTYSGTQDTTYIIEVTKGGAYASGPEITVTTTTGYDVSGPTVVTAANVAKPVGNYGVTAAFNQTALCKGDKYYVSVTAAKQGAIKTLILADDLPEAIQSATDLDLKLYIKKNLQIAQELEADAPNLSYTTTDTEITVHSGIQLYDSSWTDGGVKLPLPLKGGTLFVEYRAWLSDYVGALESVTNIADLPGLLGQSSPDNPLFWGVSLALQNSNGQPVYFTGIADPSDTDSWLQALELVEGNSQVYNLVPLTDNETVLDAWKAQVLAESAPEVANYKGAVFGITVPRVKAVVNSSLTSNGSAALAKIADDPYTSGTQYTLLSVPANNAKFQTNGVRAGDIVRFLYSTDGFGNESYSEFVVDEVLSEGSLRLVSGHTSAVTVAQRVEVWRNLNKTDLANAAKDKVAQYSDRRVVAIANDTVGANGLTFAGYFAAAAIAGLRSGVLPQQGLTNVTVSGIDDVGSLVGSLNGSQLNIIAGSGGWVIAKNAAGQIFNRHAVTTDPSDLNTREEMVRVNVDAIAYVLKEALSPFIGKSNVNRDTIQAIRFLVDSSVDALKAPVAGTSAGPQLLEGTVAVVRAHALYKDRVVVEINLTIPYPLNNIELKLVV